MTDHVSLCVCYLNQDTSQVTISSNPIQRMEFHPTKRGLLNQSQLVDRDQCGIEPQVANRLLSLADGLWLSFGSHQPPGWDVTSSCLVLSAPVWSHQHLNSPPPRSACKTETAVREWQPSSLTLTVPSYPTALQSRPRYPQNMRLKEQVCLENLILSKGVGVNTVGPSVQAHSFKINLKD